MAWTGSVKKQITKNFENSDRNKINPHALKIKFNPKNCSGTPIVIGGFVKPINS